MMVIGSFSAGRLAVLEMTNAGHPDQGPRTPFLLLAQFAFSPDGGHTESEALLSRNISHYGFILHWRGAPPGTPLYCTTKVREVECYSWFEVPVTVTE